jgi:hypothetical protein
MEVDVAMKCVSAYVHVKSRRLAYGEVVGAWRDLSDMKISPFVFVQAVLCAVGFPVHITFAVDCFGPPPEDHVSHLVEKLMSDELMPFTKSKMPLMNCSRRRSPYQELKGVTPSARRVILSSKSDMAGVIRGCKL